MAKKVIFHPFHKQICTFSAWTKFFVPDKISFVPDKISFVLDKIKIFVEKVSSHLLVKWMENDFLAMDKVLFVAKKSFSIHFTSK